MVDLNSHKTDKFANLVEGGGELRFVKSSERGSGEINNLSLT